MNGVISLIMSDNGLPNLLLASAPLQATSLARVENPFVAVKVLQKNIVLRPAMMPAVGNLEVKELHFDWTYPGKPHSFVQKVSQAWDPQWPSLINIQRIILSQLIRSCVSTYLNRPRF